MIYIELFLTFLKIGTFSFGGGYGMISLIREQMLEKAWLSEEELLNMIAVAESTPGPIAVNMATFVGSSQGGLAGALLATLGVVRRYCSDTFYVLDDAYYSRFGDLVVFGTNKL